MKTMRSFVPAMLALFGLSLFATQPARAHEVTVKASADTYITNQPEAEKSNFGTIPMLLAACDSENPVRIMIRFDLSQLDARTIRSARLRLWSVDFLGEFSNPSPTYVYAVGQPWKEDSVSWMYASDAWEWKTPGAELIPCSNSQGYFAVNNTGISIAAGQNQKIEWDVTELVKRWVSGKIANNGLMITADYGFFAFEPRETGVSGLEPSLIIEKSK